MPLLTQMTAVVQSQAALKITEVYLKLAAAGGAGHLASTSAASAAEAPVRWGKNRPYPGRVVEIESLCHRPTPQDKDTVSSPISTHILALIMAPAVGFGSGCLYNTTYNQASFNADVREPEIRIHIESQSGINLLF